MELLSDLKDLFFGPKLFKDSIINRPYAVKVSGLLLLPSSNNAPVGDTSFPTNFCFRLI
jgi:hypothetical protein